MHSAQQLHDAWAGLLAYPDERGSGFVARSLYLLDSGGVAGADRLEPFRQFLASHEVCEREELFARTFDGSDTRALEVGWHLHGENYARGALMVRLRQLLAELDLFETGELPDHIGVVLGLVGRLDDDRGGALARSLLLPALAKLLEGFEDTTNPYGSVLTGMRGFLADHHGGEEQRLSPLPSERSNS